MMNSICKRLHKQISVSQMTMYRVPLKHIKDGAVQTEEQDQTGNIYRLISIYTLRNIYPFSGTTGVVLRVCQI